MSLEMNYIFLIDALVDILDMADLPHTHLDEFSIDSDLTVQIKELLILYTKSIRLPKNNHNKIKKKILYHLSFFKQQLLQSMTLESFFELIKGLLVFYCKLELEIMSIEYEKQKQIAEYVEELICRTSDRILTVLKYYLNNSEKCILQVLLNISRQYQDKSSCAVLRILFCQFFNIYPLHNLFTEALSKKYIILMKVIEHIPEEILTSFNTQFTTTQYFTDRIMDLIFSINNEKPLRFQNNVFSFFSTIQSLVHKESSDNTICNVDVSPIDDVDDVPENTIAKNAMSTSELMTLNLMDCNSRKSKELQLIDKSLAKRAISRKPYLLPLIIKQITFCDDLDIIESISNSTQSVESNTGSQQDIIILIDDEISPDYSSIEDPIHCSELQVMHSPEPYKSNGSSEMLTIERILNDESILSECYARNKEVILSLTNVTILKNLLLMVLTKSDNELLDFDEKDRALTILCEIIPLMREFIVYKLELLDILTDFIKQKTPLDPMVASRYSRIMTVLVIKSDSESWHNYRNQCNTVLDNIQCRKLLNGLLFHIETAAIRDFLMVLMTQVYMKQRIIVFLNSNELIQSLVNLLNSKMGRAKNDSAAELLYEFSQIASNNRRTQEKKHKPDVLLATLEMPSTIRLLMSTIFTKHKSESSLLGGMKVLIGLLKFEKSLIPKYYYPKSYNITKCVILPAQKYFEEMSIQATAHVVTERLSDFHEILMHPPKKASLDTTAGVLKVPMGNTRIQVVTLLAILIRIANDDTIEKLVTLGTMKQVLNLFFAYPLNNMYHIQVYACILAAFQTYDSFTPNKTSLAMHLLTDCRLVERINKVLVKIDPYVNRTRPGYTGSLVKIANVVAEYCAPAKPLGKMLRHKAPKSFKLLQYMKVGRLCDIVLIFMTPLMGINTDDLKEADTYSTSGSDSDSNSDSNCFVKRSIKFSSVVKIY